MTQFDTHRSLFGGKLVRPRALRRQAARAGKLRIEDGVPFVRDPKLVRHIARQDYERAIREALRLALLGLRAWLGYV